MWWITIIIDVLLIGIGFVFCGVYYKKHYGDVFGSISLHVLEGHEILHGRIFGVMPNFSNFSFNILLKGIVTLVCIIVIHFTDSLWITYIFTPYLLLTYWMFKNRVKHFKSQDEAHKDAMKPALVASFSLPLFHTLYLILLYITYVLN